MARRRWHLAAALDHAAVAAEAFSATSNSYGSLSCAILSGYTNRLAGNLSGSLAQLEPVVRSGSPYRPLVAEARFQVGEVYRRLGQLPEAEKLLVASLPDRAHIGGGSPEAFSLAALGATAYQAGDYEGAAELLQRAMVRMPTAHNEGRALVARRLGVTLRELNRCGEARQLLRIALETYRKPVGNLMGEAEALLSLAVFDEEDGSALIDEAVSRIEDIIRLAHKTPMTVFVSEWAMSRLASLDPTAATGLRVRIESDDSLTVPSQGQATEMSVEPMAL